MVMAIYHYVERIREFLILRICLYNIYDNIFFSPRQTSECTSTIINKYNPGEKLFDHHQKKLRVS